MTFLEAFALHGPDTIAISEALSIPEHEADRKISAEMDKRYAERCEAKALKTTAYNREYNLRTRSELRDIRAGRPV